MIEEEAEELSDEEKAKIEEAAAKVRAAEEEVLATVLREKDKHQDSAWTRPRTKGTWREVNELNDRTDFHNS